MLESCPKIVMVASSKGVLVSASVTEPANFPVWQNVVVRNTTKKQKNKIGFTISF